MSPSTYRIQAVEELVEEALDRLPDWVLTALASVAILVLDGGEAAGAYGIYHGDGAAGEHVLDQIVIYRDTLLRDFAHDPCLLAGEVERTLQHEIAHHLGCTEARVRAVGL